MRNITTIIYATKRHLSMLLLVAIILCCGTLTTGLALDTDIYAINPRPNVAILFDTSGSMSFGVYDSSVDYKGIYLYACEQTDGYEAFDRDDPAGAGGENNPYYQMFIKEGGEFSNLDRDEIVLIKGTSGVSVTGTGDDVKTLTGDLGDPQIKWDFTGLIKTDVKLVDGELVAITGTPRLTTTTDADGNEIINLDGAPLPMDCSIALNDLMVYEDDTTMNKGFAGLMQAPGYHFTGYGPNYEGTQNTNLAKDGDSEVYFLASTNWVYMMLAYQLYTQKWDSMPTTDNFYNDIYKKFSVMGEVDNQDDVKRSFHTGIIWTEVNLDKGITSPGYDDVTPYAKNLNEECGFITQANAVKIKLHFAKLDLCNDNPKDTIIITDIETRKSLGEIDSSGPLLSGEYILDGEFQHGVYINFVTKQKNTDSTGFKIDGYMYTTEGSADYTMRRRIDVVRDAIVFVVDDTRGTINWALSGFDNNPTDGDGADIRQPFNPEHANDDTARQNIITALKGYAADGATPLGESMQDIFNHFHDKEKDFSECSRQFTILISDGFPDTLDNDWARLDTPDEITDSDGDGWMSDPAQETPIPNYLDDVAKYLYTHVFRDTDANRGIVFGEEISEDDAPNSFDNITTHTLSFTQDLPLLENTAKDGGGISLSANNEQQMINALRSLAMLAIKSASYVAPVVSVDTANKTQSGEWFYMAFFKPTGNRWVGNLKKYRLARKVKSGSCPERDEKEWVITDAIGYSANMDDALAHDAVDCEGEFLTGSKSFWSSVSDGGEVIRGGVGGKLFEKVKDAFEDGNYYTKRSIYVLRNDGTKTQITNRDSLTNTELGGITDLERYKIINYLNGYTYAVKKEITDGNGSADYDPVSYRNWPLGSLIHSTPMIIVYETVADESNPIGLKTYVVIGSNDGMLHVFDDATGEEVTAFIPEDILGNLQRLDPAKNVAGDAPSPLFFVDGQTSYYHTFDGNGKSEPKQLIFGLRRGGSSYYSINLESSDPSQWVVKWHIDDTTSGFESIGQSWSKMTLTHYRTGSNINDSSIAGIFGGGYDEYYDDKTVTENTSDPDRSGAGLYIIDIIDSNTTEGIDLLASYSYGKAVGLGISDLKYAIPANPAVIPDKYGLLDNIYFADLGGQVWNVDYNNSTFQFDNKPRLVFKSNPGSNTDRRMFYSPTVTLMGKCNFVDSDGKARPSDTPVLIVGTGDRENPTRTDIYNRIYMILDTGETDALNETNLFNVSMDDIDIDNTEKTDIEKDTMRADLATTNGWFIKFEDIDDTTDLVDVYHIGEKVLARPIIFSNVAYIPTFTPVTEDECHPKGQSKIYALNYCDGTAGVNFYSGNDDSSDKETPERFDYLDRYKTIGESIPTSPKIIIRDGSVGGFVGPVTIKTPELGKPIEIINWRELR